MKITPKKTQNTLIKAKKLLNITQKILNKEITTYNNFRLCINIGHSSSVNSVTITPDGKYIASGSSDETIKLWNIETGELVKTFEGHNDSVNSVAITPNDKYIISGSIDDTIKLWDIESGKCLATYIDFEDGGWAVFDKKYFNCNEKGFKYVNFYDGNKLISKTHPVYKERKKEKFINK